MMVPGGGPTNGCILAVEGRILALQGESTSGERGVTEVTRRDFKGLMLGGDAT